MNANIPQIEKNIGKKEAESGLDGSSNQVSDSILKASSDLSTHSVVFLGFDRIQLLDLVGPLETFQIANGTIKGTKYTTSIMSEGSSFRSESGINVQSDYTLEQFDNQIDRPFRINTLVIPGGAGSRDECVANKISNWLEQNFDAIDRVVTVCTGLFLVGNLPYLKGKEVVTHWAYLDKLQQKFPHLKVNRDRLFLQQGKFYSAAGILSGIDLALNLIEEDHGVDVASFAAKYLVTYLKRSGHQSQFSEPLKFQSHNNSHLNRINRWLTDNIAEPTTVQSLAQHNHISERHLNRLVKSHFHMSAAKYIEHVKLEQSKIYLAKQSASVEQTSDKVGYASADAFRRSFKRKYGIAPQSYRQRFQ